jgi:hypothetical protein
MVLNFFHRPATLVGVCTVSVVLHKKISLKKQ